MASQTLSIVIVTNNYTPYEGGVVSSITTQARALRSQGHKVTIITLDFEGQQKRPEPHVIRLFCPVRFTYKTNPMAVPIAPYLQIKRILKTIQPDLIHAHHPFLLGKAALHAARLLSIPCVFTYHTLYDQYLHYIPLLPACITRPIVSRFVHSFCRSIDAIIAPSSTIKSYLDREGYGHKTFLVPSSILPLFFEQPVRQKHTKAYFSLLSVSRFALEKNISFLLDVAALLDPKIFKVVLAGYGPEYAALRSYAYHYRNLSHEQVLFIQQPSKAELIQLYQHADLFIFASHTETQGLVIAEALSQGTPVITVPGPGQSDSIRDGINGFFVSTIQDMKLCIEHIAAHQDLHHQLQYNALKTAQLYTPERFIQLLLNCYKQIMLANK